LNNSIEDEPLEIAKGEVGRVIIQKMRTIRPISDDQVTIDYILFWISSEGLKKIENLINGILLNDVNSIQDESRNQGNGDKMEFLQKMDLFENHYISAQNAKESKHAYFEKIIESELVSLDFRYLIRHLQSRMTNLSNTTFVIERKLTLSRNTFQLGIDTTMAEYSKQLDKLMRKFTLISIMFVPLTIITGMWGMNCKVPYNDVDNLDCFYSLCGTMVGILVAFYAFFKYKKWM